jgi:toluene monooxygenase system protein E
MTEQGNARTRSRSLKTWSAFGDLGRRPTEYEILTHDMNHTRGDIPLEMGPDVHGNRWLREHRDSIALEVPDWNGFRDPDALTYSGYVAMQDDHETYVEGLLEQFDGERHDESLTAHSLSFLALALTPCRYLAHAEQMLSAYLQQLAPSSYIATCATFQTADQLRRVQLIAYRTTQLRRTHPDQGFATSERATWEDHPDWQPIRTAVEHALVEYDWDRALVATQLVVKPVADALFLEQLARELASAGSTVDALIVDNLWHDALRSRRWTEALLRFLVDAAPGNRLVLQRYLDQWARYGRDMLAGGSRLLAKAGGRTGEDIAAAATRSWQALFVPAGLAVEGA